MTVRNLKTSNPKSACLEVYNCDSVINECSNIILTLHRFDMVLRPICVAKTYNSFKSYYTLVYKYCFHHIYCLINMLKH